MSGKTPSRSASAITERSLTPEEFDAWVNAPLSPHEREEILSLIAWFCRRYPTPLERLDASRRMTRDALRLRELPRRPASP